MYQAKSKYMKEKNSSEIKNTTEKILNGIGVLNSIPKPYNSKLYKWSTKINKCHWNENVQYPTIFIPHVLKVKIKNTHLLEHITLK